MLWRGLLKEYQIHIHYPLFSSNFRAQLEGNAPHYILFYLDITIRSDNSFSIILESIGRMLTAG